MLSCLCSLGVSCLEDPADDEAPGPPAEAAKADVMAEEMYVAGEEAEEEVDATAALEESEGIEGSRSSRSPCRSGMSRTTSRRKSKRGSNRMHFLLKERRIKVNFRVSGETALIVLTDDSG